MVPHRVVFCDIFCQVFLSFFPEYVEMFLSDSASDPIKSHVYGSIFFLLFCFVDYAVCRCIVCCHRWTISARAVLIEVSFWHFPNNPPSSASMADAIKIIMMLNSTCTGTSSGGISWIGVFYFVPRKNILRLFFVPLVLICRIHRSICGESFHFFCILLLCLDVLRCNWETEWFFLQFKFSALSALPPGILGPLTLCGLWIWHNIRVFLQFSKVFPEYIHPILRLVNFMIASNCYLHERIVSMDMVIPAVI